MLDPDIRLFGYVPDAQALLPGDVLLVAGAGLVPGLIRRTQEQGGFHPDHARWTHAALYIGRDQLVHATPFGGVRVGPMVRITFGRELLVRRRLGDPPLTMEQRYDIAVDALTGLRRGYSLGVIPRLIWLVWQRRLWQPDRRPNVDRVTICSTIVRQSYSTSISTNLLPGVIGVTWPADLSQTAELIDVAIGWTKVVAA